MFMSCGSCWGQRFNWILCWRVLGFSLSLYSVLQFSSCWERNRRLGFSVFPEVILLFLSSSGLSNYFIFTFSLQSNILFSLMAGQQEWGWQPAGAPYQVFHWVTLIAHPVLASVIEPFPLCCVGAVMRKGCLYQQLSYCTCDFPLK